MAAWRPRKIRPLITLMCDDNGFPFENGLFAASCRTAVHHPLANGASANVTEALRRAEEVYEGLEVSSVLEGR